MRTHTTHQVLTNSQPSTMDARVQAATARVQAGMAAGTAQGGMERPSSPLTLADLGITCAATGMVLLGLVFVVQTLIGWFTPATGDFDGICREYRNSVVVCAPAYSPDGAEMTRMWEDGSAVYVDGYVFGGYSEDATQTIGTYAVPGGELTVYGDASAYYAPTGS